MGKILMTAAFLFVWSVGLESEARGGELSAEGTVRFSSGTVLFDGPEVVEVGEKKYYNTRALDGSIQGASLAALSEGYNYGYKIDQARFVLRVSEESDEHLSYEGVVEVSADSGRLMVDEAYFLLGLDRLGSLQLGFDDGVDYGPFGDGGLPEFDAWEPFALEYLSAKAASYVDKMFRLVGDGADSAQIRYTSPTWSGFKASVAYKPSSIYMGDPGNPIPKNTAARLVCDRFTKAENILPEEALAPCLLGYDRPAQFASEMNPRNKSDLAGQSHIVTAGVQYSAEGSPFGFTAWANGLFSMNGQDRSGGGNNWAVRVGYRGTYDVDYIMALSFIYGQTRQTNTTDKNRQDYFGLSLGLSSQHSLGQQTLAVGWQVVNRYALLTQEEFDLGTIGGGQANPYKPLRADHGLILTADRGYNLSPGVRLSTTITFVLGVPGGSVQASYNGVVGGNPIVQNDASVPTNYPIAHGLLFTLGARVSL